MSSSGKRGEKLQAPKSKLQRNLKRNASVTAAGRARLSSARRGIFEIVARRAELIYPTLLFSCADFPGNTDKLHGRSTGGGRVSRSVWSAWSLLPLSNRATHPTAGASSTHSIRFAPFGSGSAGLRTDAPYPRSPDYSGAIFDAWERV